MAVKEKYLSKAGLDYLFERGLRFTWQGKREDWDKLSDEEKAKYDNAYVEEPPSDEPAQPKIWAGTQDEWDALTDEEKAKYDIAMIAD